MEHYAKPAGGRGKKVMLNKKLDSDGLVAAYKRLFSTPDGEVVLDNLTRIFGGHVNAELFSEQSERRTCYNLGAFRVLRHIRSYIEADIGEKRQDCIIEEKIEIAGE
jgi:hypothetical protein